MTQSLMQEPVQSYEDGSGNPLNAGQLFTYAAGTLTPKATYQDAAGSTPNANPIVLNARGEAVVYGSGNYRMILKDSGGATIWDRDNVNGGGYNGSDIGAIFKDQVPHIINSISDLRLIDKTKYTRVWVTGYTTPGDGGGGSYWYDSSDVTSADDNGTIIVASDGGRWKLQSLTVVSVKQYGAKGDGVTNDSAAFASAVAATAAGGVIVCNGNFTLSTNVSAANRNFIVYGVITGAGALTGDGLNITYSNGSPQTSQTPFGTGFTSHDLAISKGVNTHPNTIATSAVVRTATGSGNNGPANADVALMVASSKDSWQTSAVRGEIDGVYVVVRQGQKDDQAGILVDHHKVGGDTGGSMGMEISGSFVNNADVPVLTLQTGNNFLEAAGGFSGNTGYGFWAENQVGAAYAAFHAGNATPGAFQNVITAGSSRNPASLYYQVDGAGRSRASAGSQALPSYSFVGSTNNGMYLQNTNALGFVTGGGLRYVVDPSGHLLPGNDNTQNLGAALTRMSIIYAGTGTINTSDAREKQDISPISDAVLDAWADVEFVEYRWVDAVTQKGEAARKHIGLIAQNIYATFQRHGINALEYGLLCYDEWEATDEHPAGNRWGIRPDQCLFLNAALQRREMRRLKDKIEQLSANPT